MSARKSCHTNVRSATAACAADHGGRTGERLLDRDRRTASIVGRSRRLRSRSDLPVSHQFTTHSRKLSQTCGTNGNRIGTARVDDGLRAASLNLRSQDAQLARQWPWSRTPSAKSRPDGARGMVSTACTWPAAIASLVGDRVIRPAGVSYSYPRSPTGNS